VEREVNQSFRAAQQLLSALQELRVLRLGDMKDAGSLDQQQWHALTEGAFTLPSESASSAAACSLLLLLLSAISRYLVSHHFLPSPCLPAPLLCRCLCASASLLAAALACAPVQLPLARRLARSAR